MVTNCFILRGGAFEVPRNKIDAIHSAQGLLETLLQNTKYLVGDSVTLADFSCATTVFTLEFLITIDVDNFPKIIEWIERLNELPYFVEHNANMYYETTACSIPK